jgi:hypothetical protein
MNVNKVLSKDYGNICLYKRGKNKPKQTQSNPIKAKTNPIQTQTNPIQVEAGPAPTGLLGGEDPYGQASRNFFFIYRCRIKLH